VYNLFVEKIANQIIRFSFYLLFFLVPLFFSAKTSELFEYNKMMLTYAFTIVITAAWLVRMILVGKIIFKKSFWQIPLLFYLGAHILSTVFSIDPHISIWGYYSRFHEGLLATISYTLLYFAAVSNLEKADVKKIFISSFLSAAIVSVWGILESLGHSPSCLIITGKFGVDCWIQDVKNRVFATLGQPNWMAAYLCVLILTAFGFGRRIKNYELSIKGLLLNSYYLILPLFLCALYATHSRSGFLGLAVGLGVLVLLLLKLDKRIKLLFCAFGLVGASVFGARWYQNLPTAGTGITSSETIRKPVWEGAIKIWQRYPIFGSGVETFGYAFYQDRPISKNMDSEWDFLYNKAHNEYLNLLATTGTVGILAYFFLIGSFIIYIPIVFQILASQGVPLRGYSLLAAWTSILITNLIGFSVVVIGLYFFLIPAFCFLLAQNEEPPSITSTKKLDTFSFCLISLIGFIGFIGLLNLLNMWQADKAYALGKNYNSVQQHLVAYPLLIEAVKADSDEPTFRTELAYNQAILASALFEQIKESTTAAVASLSAEQKMNLESPQLKASVNSLIAQAMQNTNQAVKQSPYSVPFWKDQTKIFYQLATIDKKYYLNALEAITTAAKLAPTDAKIWYNLALLQNITGNKTAALLTLDEVIKMKPDYTDAINSKKELEKPLP